MTATEKRNNALLEIATTTLGLDTLDTRSSDGLDFSDQAVWQIKEALEAAYQAGAAAEAARPAGGRKLALGHQG